MAQLKMYGLMVQLLLVQIILGPPVFILDIMMDQFITLEQMVN